MELDALPVLMGFADGAAPREVFERLQEEWEIDEDGFAEVVDAMVAQNFLTPLDATDSKTVPALAQEGFSSLLLHHRMLSDPVRVMSYRAAIARHCAGKVVVEIGCGTGILSIFAARAGARRVIAIEESTVADLARRMFAANGCDGVVELRLGNSRDVELDEPADVVVHEILGVDPFVENLLLYVGDARRRFLGSGGLLLPRRLQVFAAGVELAEMPNRDRERMKAEAVELAGLYGIDFGPYLDELSSFDPRLFLPPVAIGDESFFEPKILSEEHLLLDVDLHDEAPDVEGQLAAARLRIRQEGTLSGVVLYFRAHLDETTWLSTSPFAPRTSWGWDVRHLHRRLPVAAGDEVGLDARIETFQGKQRLRVDLTPAG